MDRQGRSPENWRTCSVLTPDYLRKVLVMTRVRHLLMLLMLEVLLSCSKTLSRSDAKEKIAAYLADHPTTQEILCGYPIHYQDSQTAMADALRSKGYIVSTNITTGNFQHFRFSPLARPFLIKPDEGCSAIITAHIVVKEVTGLVNDSNKTSTRADFKYTVTPTPIGPLVNENLARAEITGSGQASFELYDDGWRIKGITAANPN